MKRLRRQRKIIVIGAGIAGLTAARLLQSQGYTVIVLESTTRVGGRLKTNRSLDFAFDEGASWIHTPIGNPITNLAKKAGLKLFMTDDESLTAYDVVGKVISDKRFEIAEKMYNEMIETLYNYGKLGTSFETIYKEYYPERNDDLLQQFFLSNYLTFDTGGLEVLSSLYYDEGKAFRGKEKIVTNGYDTLAQWLGNPLNIKFEERVTRISYPNQQVVVETEKNYYEADQVIVTVPLGVLKKEVIIFDPPIPEQKQIAIKDIGMNKVDKFYFQWDEVFFDDTQYIAYTAKEKDSFSYYLNLNKINPNTKSLMTFAFANQAVQLEQESDKMVIDKVMTYLRVLYGARIPRPRHMLRTKWAEDPNAYGAYSFTSTQTRMAYFEELARPIENKLFLAGEHTSRAYYATVHGAYLSGLRVAREVYTRNH